MSDSATVKRPIAATWVLVALGSLAGCAEPPPPTVSELVADPVLLEATMVRCLSERTDTKYAAACINAREAAGQIALAAEQARRGELEAQSERKREALRRAQEAADAARQQAMELAEQRKTAEYLGILPPPANPEAAPAETEDLHFITVGESPAASGLLAGDDGSPHVTVQEIDLSSAMIPAAPPEPEPEAE